jgi:hypothetical protein
MYSFRLSWVFGAIAPDVFEWPIVYFFIALLHTEKFRALESTSNSSPATGFPQASRPSLA